MSRASGAGAYSQGIAWPSPRPQLVGAREGAGLTARCGGVSVVTRALCHRPSAPSGAIEPARRPGPSRLPLCRSERQPTDEVALQDEEHEDGRDRREQRPRRQQIEVGEELTLEVVQ